MKIEKIGKSEAIEFVYKYHYSKYMPHNTRQYLGIYEEGVLCGVVTLGYGANPLGTIRTIFNKHNLFTIDYIEIGKMCFLPNRNNDKCFGSKALSQLIKWLKENTCFSFLYTMADGIMGKCGYVYQAANFKYVGKFKTEVYMDIKTKERIHPLSTKGNKLLKENQEYCGGKKLYILTPEFCEYAGIDIIKGYMFRYVYPLDKTAKQILDTYSEYKNLKNPKDSDLTYERRIGYRKYIHINQPIFASK